MIIKNPKGTKDYFPEEMARRIKVMNSIRQVFTAYGYGEISTPAFEYLEVLEKKGALGDENVKDVYRIKDKGDRWLGLKFDMTTPISRVIASNPELIKPTKLFYITNMWRYENPQKGRLREFWQAGIEYIGTNNRISDAEILAVTYDSLIKLGIKDFVFKINSRQILDGLANSLNVTDKESFYKLLDKKDKLPKEDWTSQLKDLFDNKENYQRFLELIDLSGQPLIEKIKSIASTEVNSLQEIINFSKILGVDEKVLVPDLSVVRGLDYYTGFIFETYKLGHEKLGSLASGGRYDNLVISARGDKEPSTGMAIGIERIMEFVPDEHFVSLKEKKILVIPLGDAAQKVSLSISRNLRDRGLSCETELSNRNLKKILSVANERGIDYTIIIGDNEINSNNFVIKNMHKKEQKTLNLEELVKYIKNDN